MRTNDDPVRPLDFRYYLDLNRNFRFESNGPLPILGPRGQYLGTNGQEAGFPVNVPVVSNFFVGDPEWIGVLSQPGTTHGPTNRFLGRMAYLVQLVGKSLDMNFIGNHALRPGDTALQGDGYYRNQGVGSWELNLAAFLRDLNTNATRNYSLGTLTTPSTSEAARDALAFLRYRYDGNLTNLLSVQALFGQTGVVAFAEDRIDGYTDGPAFGATNLLGLATDNDTTPANKPWPADSPRTYTELQELFDTNKVIGDTTPSWPARLLLAQSGPSSYDRYTFYRMLGQIRGLSPAPVTRAR